MTNAEKFYEVFGTRGWVDWDAEYKGEPTIPLSVIEKIKAEIERESDYKPYEMYDMKWAFNKALSIIDKAVKEVKENERTKSV